MKSASGVILFLMLLLSHQIINAQHNSPDTIIANHVTEKIDFDGKLSELFWQKVSYVNNFTQRELDYGKPSTEQTKVAIVYDDLALYIGIWCYQKQNTIRAKFLQRDFDYDQDDLFAV